MLERLQKAKLWKFSFIILWPVLLCGKMVSACSVLLYCPNKRLIYCECTSVIQRNAYLREQVLRFFSWVQD